jgi:uncharacterized protein
MLEMKSACAKCNAELSHQDAAYICSYECTFCSDCSSVMDYTCPNCGGELLKRPGRKALNQ